jgi:ribonuclease R
LIHQKELNSPARSGQLVGTIAIKSEGYGFVALEGGKPGEDLFVPPRQTGGAMDGDRVRIRRSRGRDGRTVAEVVEVVERRRKLLAGVYRRRGARAFIEPADQKLGQPIPADRRNDLPDGTWVKARLQTGPGGDLEATILGPLEERDKSRLETLLAAYAQGFCDEFPAAVLAAAETIPEAVRAEDLGGEQAGDLAKGRRDLRALPLVTIDGADAKDFDDAVHVQRSGAGYRLYVAIADVAHYVRPGGAIDGEALGRGTSVYFPGTVLPMLPERLSNGICSLKPQVDRLCLVCELTLDGAGNPTGRELYPAVMKSRARLTYEQVAQVLTNDPAAPAELDGVRADLLVAGELSAKRTAIRRARGSIELELAEPRILLREDGSVEDIVLRPRNAAHQLVEEFMLAANEAVAEFFTEAGLPTLYRIHEQPDEAKLAAFAALAQAHGFTVPESPSPRELNTLLLSLREKPAGAALNALLLRAMMQARYSPEDLGHYGLAAQSYLHFTSPIRRYPDLVVHRLLWDHWQREGRKPSAQELHRRLEELEALGLATSERERAAQKAEREVNAFYAARLMQEHIGETFDAVVTGAAEPGLFCQLVSPAVEGLIPLESLGPGASFDPDQHRVSLGTGRSMTLGDKLRATVVSSDPVRRRIALALADQPGAAAPAPRGTPKAIPPDEILRLEDAERPGREKGQEQGGGRPRRQEGRRHEPTPLAKAVQKLREQADRGGQRRGKKAGGQKTQRPQQGRKGPKSAKGAKDGAVAKGAAAGGRPKQKQGGDKPKQKGQRGPAGRRPRRS